MRYPREKPLRRFEVTIYTDQPERSRRVLSIVNWPEPHGETWASNGRTTRLHYRVAATSADELMNMLHNVEGVVGAGASAPIS